MPNCSFAAGLHSLATWHCLHSNDDAVGALCWGRWWRLAGMQSLLTYAWEIYCADDRPVFRLKWEKQARKRARRVVHNARRRAMVPIFHGKKHSLHMSELLLHINVIHLWFTPSVPFCLLGKWQRNLIIGDLAKLNRITMWPIIWLQLHIAWLSSVKMYKRR